MHLENSKAMHEVDVFEKYYSFDKLDKGNPYFEVKKQNYLLTKEEYSLGKYELKSLPLRATIQTTDYCNLKCIMCQIHSQRERHSLKQMSKNGFDQIVRKLFPTLIEAHPTNIGEPLISPWFDYLCEKCKEYGVLLDITSNGTLLSEERIIEILPCLLDIKISFDGFKKDTFESIRKGADYETVIKNIKTFIHYRDIFSSSATITLQMTLFDFNYKELSDIIKFAKEIGVNKVKAYPAFSYSEEIDKVSLMNSLDLFSEYRSYCIDLAKRIGMPLSIAEPPAEKNDDTEYLIHQKCRLPWAECFIDYDGMVYPCHSHNNRTLGDIFNCSEYDVWNSSYAQSIRKVLLSGNQKNTICDNCGNNYVRLNIAQSVPYNKDDYLFYKTGDKKIHWGNRYKQFLLNR